MTCRKKKPISVCPLGVLRVVPEKACPQNISHWRTAQRKTGMARLSFLNSIERESADRVDAKLIESFVVFCSFIDALMLLVSLSLLAFKSQVINVA